MKKAYRPVSGRCFRTKVLLRTAEQQWANALILRIGARISSNSGNQLENADERSYAALAQSVVRPFVHSIGGTRMYVKCPFCNAVYRDLDEMDSVEAFAEWTDAFEETTLGDWQRVLFCHECCHVSATADCILDNSTWIERITAKTKFKYQWPWLTILLHSGAPIGSLKERDLLMELWHLGNQYNRMRASVRGAGDPWDDPRFLSLIRRLAGLLSAGVSDPLLAAEVHRELGEFEMCRRLLDKLRNDALSKPDQRRLEIILKECDLGNRVVVKL